MESSLQVYVMLKSYKFFFQFFRQQHLLEPEIKVSVGSLVSYCNISFSKAESSAESKKKYWKWVLSCGFRSWTRCKMVTFPISSTFCKIQAKRKAESNRGTGNFSISCQRNAENLSAAFDIKALVSVQNHVLMWFCSPYCQLFQNIR